MEAAHLLGPGRVRPGRRGGGDALAAGCTATATPWCATSCSSTAGWQLDRHVDELGRTLGEELLEPTRIYAKACLALARGTRTHAMSHITGGGLAANLARVLPDEVAVDIDRGTWTPAPVFDLVREVGGVARADLEQTLNMGVGMVALCDADDTDRVVATLAEHDVEAWVCGQVRRAEAGRRARLGDPAREPPDPLIWVRTGRRRA